MYKNYYFACGLPLFNLPKYFFQRFFEAIATTLFLCTSVLFISRILSIYNSIHICMHRCINMRVYAFTHSCKLCGIKHTYPALAMWLPSVSFGTFVSENALNLTGEPAVSSCTDVLLPIPSSSLSVVFYNDIHLF